jgi:hypothetical protein
MLRMMTLSFPHCFIYLHPPFWAYGSNLTNIISREVFPHQQSCEQDLPEGNIGKYPRRRNATYRASWGRGGGVDP